MQNVKTRAPRVKPPAPLPVEHAADALDYAGLDYLTVVTIFVPVDIFGNHAELVVDTLWFTRHTSLEPSDYFQLACSCGAYVTHDGGPSRGIFTVRNLCDLPPHVLASLQCAGEGSV